MNNPHLIQFTNILKSITDISDSEIEKLYVISKTEKIAKGECFIREGNIPETFGFVYQGLFRYYYLTETGKEFTKGFFAENAFISAYSALINNRESHFSIEALEDSIISVINYHAWKKLIETSLSWHKILLFLLEKGYCTKEEREREFLLFDAQTRYQIFLDSHPGLERRIKQHYIASYLGITPVALSRIRRSMNL